MTDKRLRTTALLRSILCPLLIGLLSQPALACHDGSPIVLDLGGDGKIRTTSFSVIFDIDADGYPDEVLWLDQESEDGFLFLDRNRNGIVDDGGELFGDATLLPSGEHARDGFDALAVHDRLDHGGDLDGLITSGDRVWRDLRLWIDKNHDGASQRREIFHLRRFGVVALDLQSEPSDAIDGHGNRPRLKGRYLRRSADRSRVELEELPMWDIYFRILH